MIATGVSIPLLCLEGVPDLSSAPKDEAGLTRKFAEVGPEKLHFYHASGNCWSCCSTDHSSRATGLDVQRCTLVLGVLGQWPRPCIGLSLSGAASASPGQIPQRGRGEVQAVGLPNCPFRENGL